MSTSILLAIIGFALFAGGLLVAAVLSNRRPLPTPRPLPPPTAAARGRVLEYSRRQVEARGEVEQREVEAAAREADPVEALIDVRRSRRRRDEP